MKQIAFVALLAAAGCSKKGSDCGAAIGQGVDRYMAEAKQLVAGSPRLEAALSMADQLKAAMTRRCNDDKWSPDAVSCFGAVASSGDLKACQDKLTQDQRTKLVTAVFPIMMGGAGANGSRMPPGLAGHPPMLTGSGGGPGSPPGEAAGSAATGSAAAPAMPSGQATPVPGTPAAPPSGSSAN